MASPPTASTLPVSAVVISASLGGMKFEYLPPLPIIAKTFGFFKRVNLSSLGLGLNEVPPEIGRDLVLWEPILEQYGLKGVLGTSEVQTEVVDVVDDSSLSEGDSDSVPAEAGPEPVSNLSEFGTRSEHVPSVSEAGSEPPPMFEQNVDDSFDRVTDFEKHEDVDTPIMIVHPKTVKIP